MPLELEKIESSSSVKTAEAENAASIDYPRGARLVVVVISLMLAMFLISLDNVSRIQSIDCKAHISVPRPSSAPLFPRSRMSFMI